MRNSRFKYMPLFNTRGDACFVYGRVFFIFRTREGMLTGKKIYPGFHHWSPDKGLIGPFHSVNVAEAAYFDHLRNL